MEYRKLGKTGIEVSCVGLGTLTMAPAQLKLDVGRGAELIRYALGQGINLLDTAQYYASYPYIREALKDGKYEPVISTKSLARSASGMRGAVEEARKALNRDVIDVFFLHEVRSEEDFEDRAAAWEVLQEAKAKGLVKAIGLSTHHTDVAELAVETEGLDVLFPLINCRGLGIRRFRNQGKKEDMEQAIAACGEKGIGVFAMKAFGGGNLVKYYGEALDYVFSLPGVSTVMLGMGKEKEVDDIISYVNKTLEADYAPDLSKKRIYVTQDDCEGCGTCVKRCPNMAMYINEYGRAEVNQKKCVICGYCAPVCPVRAIVMLEK